MTVLKDLNSKQRTKRTKVRKKDLAICIDLGTSLIKVSYLIDRLSIGYLEIAPEYTKLPAQSARRLPGKSKHGLPQNTAWLRYDKDRECHLIGNLAIEHRGFVAKKTLKWQMATPKILSAIAIVLEREQLNPTSVKLSVVGILLPKEEIAARSQLTAQIVDRIKTSFYWREEKIKVAIAPGAVCIAPEISGLVLDDLERDRDIADEVRLYLMGGKKHWSIDTYINGTYSEINSGCKDLGMFNLDRLMEQKIPGWNPDFLEMALITTEPDERKLDAVTYIEKHSDDRVTIDWEKIARQRGADNLETEAKNIERAYHESLEECWFICRDWLRETTLPPDDINTVVYCGGATQLYRDPLSEYFASSDRQLWNNHAIEVVTVLGIGKCNSKPAREFFARNYQVRFADVVKYLLVLSGYQSLEYEAQ